MSLFNRNRTARRAARSLNTNAAAVAEAARYRAALVAISETTGAIKVPNGTTKKIARVVSEALES
jgi:hypothetical protein